MEVFSARWALCVTLQTAISSSRWVIEYLRRLRSHQREWGRVCHVSMYKVNTLATVCLCADTSPASTPVCFWVQLCLRHTLLSKLYMPGLFARFPSGCVFIFVITNSVKPQQSNQSAKHTPPHALFETNQYFTVVLSSFLLQGNWRTWGCHGNWPLAPTPYWSGAAPSPDGCSERWAPCFSAEVLFGPRHWARFW